MLNHTQDLVSMVTIKLNIHAVILFTIQVNLLHLPTSANIVLIIYYLLIIQSIIHYKNQKHFNQFTMSLLFCVILFYMIFLVSAAALRSTTVGSEPTSTGRCEPVGTEQRSTGPLVVFASLRSVQSGHPLDVLHPCICPYQSS